MIIQGLVICSNVPTGEGQSHPLPPHWFSLPAGPSTQGGTTMASLWALRWRGGCMWLWALSPAPRVAFSSVHNPPSPPSLPPVPWHCALLGAHVVRITRGLLRRCGLICASGLQPPCCPRTDIQHQATCRAQVMFAEGMEAERPGNSQPPANMAEPITATDGSMGLKRCPSASFG